MDCGGDIACDLIDWLSANGYIVRQIAESIDALWDQAGGQITALMREHGEKLVAILSFCFALWRWWIYREGILHKRLLEYVKESDERLGPAATATYEAILRPGRAAALPQPAYALELRGILVRHGWSSLLRFSSAERQTERRLGRALKGIRKRRQIMRAASQSLREQQSQVHLLAGAVAVGVIVWRLRTGRRLPRPATFATAIVVPV